MAKPSPETLRLRASRAYIFRVLYQGKPRNIEGVAGMENGEWVMPVYPASVNYRSQARSMVYATSGGAGGGERGADEQGKDPPIITLSGTFSEQGAYRPGVGGLDGRAAQRAFENLIGGYLKLVHDEGMLRNPMHVLEWHDLYREESWVVTPANVPYGTEDSSRPLIESYQLSLTALHRTTTPAIHSPDPISLAAVQKHGNCPLNPRCRFGGPSVPGCPWRKK